jgi:putative restriction endonuclease
VLGLDGRGGRGTIASASTMDGWIAVTDYGWYQHLLARQMRARGTADDREVNFWQPSARSPKKMGEGTPFLFKLKKPHDAICGFGYFAGFSKLPDWLAWETFGEGNGVGSLAALRERMAKIRARNKIANQTEIGCCLIAQAQFWPPAQWVRQPRDWGPNIVVGATYDLAQGEGARVWAEARASAQREEMLRAVTVEDAPRWGRPVVVEPRLGQGIFRVKVLDAYERRCAVTGEHSLPVLDAAHVRPYAEGGEHRVENGLALRTDLHRLFDRGYVGFDEQRRLVVSRRLKEEYQNGKVYYEMQGQALRLPSGGRGPDEALAWHRQRRFLG